MRYAGAAKGINWQILSTFLNRNSQFESNQPFIIPKDPPIKLVRKRTVREPIISFPPVTPNERFPLNIIVRPSFRKFIIGKTITIAITNETKSKALKFKSLLLNWFKTLHIYLIF